MALRAAAHILYYPEAWYTLHIDAPEGGTKMETEKVYAMPFAKIYPMLVDELAKGKVMEKIKRRNKMREGKAAYYTPTENVV